MNAWAIVCGDVHDEPSWLAGVYLDEATARAVLVERVAQNTEAEIRRAAYWRRYSAEAERIGKEQKLYSSDPLVWSHFMVDWRAANPEPPQPEFTDAWIVEGVLDAWGKWTDYTPPGAMKAQ